MARSYTIKKFVVHKYRAVPVGYATNIQYQVCDEATTVVSSRNPFTGITADHTKIVRTPQGSVQTLSLIHI